jgi:hypothetical protein
MKVKVMKVNRGEGTMTLSGTLTKEYQVFQSAARIATDERAKSS